MLSQLVVLFTLLVIQAQSEQFECDVVPFETNEVRGSCCIYSKNNFRRPSIEEINRQIQGKFNEKKILPNAGSTLRNSGRHNERIPNYETTEFRQGMNPVTEIVNSYDSNSGNVPFIDRNRPIKPNPVAHQEPTYTNSDTRHYTKNNQPRVNEGYNTRSEDNSNRRYNTESESRPLSSFGRNETPDSRNVERTFPKVEKGKSQEKADRSIFQSKNGSSYNSINRTGEENLYEKTPKPENASIPDIGNRNNVNVPDTCTEGFTKDANGKCVERFT